MAISKFYEWIKTARDEKGVVDVYNYGFKKYFPNEIIKYPYKCDGLIDKRAFLRLLIEYKFDEDLHNTASRAKVLIQVIYYLKQFELNGEKLPNVVMVGDINEVFVMHTNPLLKYLDENIDWKIAPSCVHDKNPELLLKISKDEDISPYVYDINNEFSFKEIAEKIEEVATNTVRKVRVTEHNISKIFDDFVARVLKNSDKIAPNDLVGIFISSIIDRDNCYQHPNNENKLVCHNKQYDINGKYYKTFFSHFEKEYSPEDKNKFTEISDRLIEDTKRRRSGEFYTPTLFTDYAHKMLSEELGEDWKEKYVVWDCCWGTGNLTRDYQFRELYASTLEQAELDCGKRYNKHNAEKFIFDFLNDDISNILGCNIPPKLYETLKQNKPIVFFINPPYGTASNAGATGTSKEGCAKTKVNQTMLQHKIGGGSQNLYAQFLYKICSIVNQFNLTNVAIGLFSPVLFLTGPSFKRLRDVFLNTFEYYNGIQFLASYFNDVADSWGISFSVWKKGITENRNEFEYKLVEINENDEIEILDSTVIYNLDNMETASNWAKSIDKTNEKVDCLCFTSAINNGTKIKKLNKGYLSCFANDANNVDGNGQGVYFINTPITRHVAVTEVRDDNFIKTVTLFAARRLVSQNWHNWYQEYKIPNINHDKWNEFTKDSIVFSLFESKSQQSSLRNIVYNKQNWNIKNEFFYMSKKEITELANIYNLEETYEQARISEDRYVYKKLKEITLSKEAQDVLDKAIELTKKSFEMRKLFDESHPEYQILNWDCGWYQIKALLQEYYKDDLNQFKEFYKILVNKMNPMVYELGFLKK